VLRDAEAVFFTCEGEMLLARQSFWLYQCHEVAVNYGTQGIPSPSRNYASAFLHKHPAIAAKHRLLFLGRVHPKKAPDLLLLALADLQRQRLWDPQTMVLVMAGPADGAYAEQLRRLAASLGIAASIHWTGMLQGDDKWGTFQAADAFVLPSHQENFGIAVAEALSCSTPVLIFHAVNIAAEIAADGSGLVEADTHQGIRSLLQRWLALSPEARSAMAAKARHCYETRYQITIASTSITRAIYTALLQRRLMEQ
jgi:glycosyltransferase involved in cell wall biosynthesis